MPTKGIKPGMGRMIIGDTVFEGPITDFTYDPESVEKYVEDILLFTPMSDLSFTVSAKLNEWALLKISGLWQWVIDNCPNKRVVYLMHHGSYRTRKKNWHRACDIISRMCTEVKL